MSFQQPLQILSKTEGSVERGVSTLQALYIAEVNFCHLTAGLPESLQPQDSTDNIAEGDGLDGEAIQ
jgi:hypothetical protein